METDYMAKKNIDLSIIIPCFNSELYLESNVTNILDVLNSHFKIEFEVILVIDGSPDKTIEVAKHLSSKFKNIRTLELTRNFGQHPALFAGISLSCGELIVTMDDDGQHTPSGLIQLLNSASPVHDVIYGIAEEEEHDLFRNFFSRFTKRIIFGVLGIKNARNISAFRLIRREIFHDIDFSNLSRGTLDVIINWNTTKISWTRVTMSKRSIGKSNYRLTSLVRFALDMVTNYSTRPLRIATISGAFGFIVSMCLAIYFGLQWLDGNVKVPGFTTLAILTCTLGSIQLLALGIIGEYLGKIHEKSSSRPAFTIRNTWN